MYSLTKIFKYSKVTSLQLPLKYSVRYSSTITPKISIPITHTNPIKNNKIILFNNNNNISKNNINLIKSNSLLENVRYKSTFNRQIKYNYGEEKEGESLSQIVQSNVGLRSYLNKVYLVSGASFIGMLASGLGAAALHINPMTAIVVGLVGSIGSMIAFSKSEVTKGTETHRYKNQKVLSPVAKYSGTAQTTFALVPVFVGISISPALAFVPMALVLKAGILAASVSFSTAYFALKMQPESLSPYKNVAYGSLFGLLGISLIGVASSLIYGPSAFTETITSLNLYGGLALFTFLNAIDTHNAVDNYRNDEPNHLADGLSIFLNMVNIFTRILHILKSVIED